MNLFSVELNYEYLRAEDRSEVELLKKSMKEGEGLRVLSNSSFRSCEEPSNHLTNGDLNSFSGIFHVNKLGHLFLSSFVNTESAQREVPRESLDIHVGSLDGQRFVRILKKGFKAGAD